MCATSVSPTWSLPGQHGPTLARHGAYVSLASTATLEHSNTAALLNASFRLRKPALSRLTSDGSPREGRQERHRHAILRPFLPLGSVLPTSVWHLARVMYSHCIRYIYNIYNIYIYIRMYRYTVLALPPHVAVCKQKRTRYKEKLDHAKHAAESIWRL